MKLVLLGEDSFSAVVLNSLLEAGYTLLSVYCPYYSNIVHARLESVCLQHNIPFHRIQDFSSIDFENQLKQNLPDLIIICHFQKIIKSNIISLPKFGCINLHPSLLPKYRGMSPQHWPIINGDDETGITVHFVDSGIDTGDIIVQERIKIAKDEYVFDLQKRMTKIYRHIVVDALEKIKLNNKNYFKQSHLDGSYYGRLQIKNCIIVLELGVEAAYNLVRAVSYPYFGARLNEQIIWRASIASDEQTKLGQLAELLPGFYSTSIIGPIIKFNDGILIVKKYSIIK